MTKAGFYGFDQVDNEVKLKSIAKVVIKSLLGCFQASSSGVEKAEEANLELGLLEDVDIKEEESDFYATRPVLQSQCSSFGS